MKHLEFNKFHCNCKNSCKFYPSMIEFYLLDGIAFHFICHHSQLAWKLLQKLWYNWYATMVQNLVNAIKFQWGFNYSYKSELWSLCGICKGVWHMNVALNE